MKKLLTVITAALLLTGANAQIILSRAYTPPTGKDYFEVANTGTTLHNLAGYSLVSYYRNANERGFYVITFPPVDLSPNSSVMLGASVTREQMQNSPDLKYNLEDLFRGGQLRRFVLDQGNNRFSPYNGTESPEGFFNRIVGSTTFDDHLVLLYRNNTLVDASFRVDANRRLSRNLQLLPNLSFENTAGQLMTVRFGALESSHPQIFNRPNPQQDFGYFREFQLRRHADRIEIGWHSLWEQDNRGFEIERRRGNEPWTTVAYVATLAPTGNSNSTLHYLYGDRTFLGGNVQYRLRQVDINGTSTYSPVRTLNEHGAADKVVVFPNPSPDGRATIAFGNVNAMRDVQLIGPGGQVVRQWVSVNNNQQQLTDLRAGQYFVRVIDRQHGTVQTEKLIVGNR